MSCPRGRGSPRTLTPHLLYSREKTTCFRLFVSIIQRDAGGIHPLTQGNSPSRPLSLLEYHFRSTGTRISWVNANEPLELLGSLSLTFLGQYWGWRVQSRSRPRSRSLKARLHLQPARRDPLLTFFKILPPEIGLSRHGSPFRLRSISKRNRLRVKGEPCCGLRWVRCACHMAILCVQSVTSNGPPSVPLPHYLMTRTHIFLSPRSIRLISHGFFRLF